MKKKRDRSFVQLHIKIEIFLNEWGNVIEKRGKALTRKQFYKTCNSLKASLYRQQIKIPPSYLFFKKKHHKLNNFFTKFIIG